MIEERLRKRTRPPVPRKSGPEAKDRPGKKKLRLACRDPLIFLNADVIDILLSYLSSVDLARCERVSRRWRDWIEGFAAQAGTRLHFRDLWNPGQSQTKSTNARYQEYKQMARYRHTVSTGKTSSTFKFDNVGDFLVCRGNYVAWSLLCHPLKPPVIYWRSLERLDDGSFPQPKRVPIERLPNMRNHSDPTVTVAAPRLPLRGIVNIDMNEDGLLLLQLSTRHDSSALSWILRTGRDLIYSPIHREYLWKQDCYRGPESMPDYIPLLLGKNWVYCARRVSDDPQDDYVLAARDFRTNEEIYQSRALRFTERAFSHDAGSVGNVMRLLRSSEGNEIIVAQIIPAADDGNSILVINASNGHLIQRIIQPYDNNDLEGISTHPGIDFVSLTSHTWIPSESIEDEDCPEALKGYQICVLERFSKRTEDFLNTLSAYIILVPYSAGWSSSLFNTHPGALGVLACSEKNGITAHATVPVEDSELRRVVNAEVKREFKELRALTDVHGPAGRTTTIGNILRVTDGEKVTLPPKARVRRVFKPPKEHLAYYAQFTEEGQILLFSDGTCYLLNF